MCLKGSEVGVEHRLDVPQIWCGGVEQERLPGMLPTAFERRGDRLVRYEDPLGLGEESIMRKQTRYDFLVASSLTVQQLDMVEAARGLLGTEDSLAKRLERSQPATEPTAPSLLIQARGL